MVFVKHICSPRLPPFLQTAACLIGLLMLLTGLGGASGLSAIADTKPSVVCHHGHHDKPVPQVQETVSYVTGVIRYDPTTLDPTVWSESLGDNPFSSLAPGESVQEVVVQITEGEHAQDIVTLYNVTGGGAAFDIPLERDARVVLREETSKEGRLSYNLVDRERLSPVLFFLGIYILVLVLTGRRAGIKSLLLIAGMICSVQFILFPGALKGISPLLTTLVVCISLLYAMTALYWKQSPEGKIVFYSSVDTLLVGTALLIFASTMATLRGLTTEGLGYVQNGFPQIDLLEIHYASWLVLATGLIFHGVHTTIRSVRHRRKEIVIDETTPINDVNLIVQEGRYVFSTLNTSLAFAASGLVFSWLFQWMWEDPAKLLNLEQVVTYLIDLVVLLTALALSTPLTVRTAKAVYK